MQLPDCMPGKASAQVDHSAVSTTEKHPKKDIKSEYKRPAGLQAQVSDVAMSVEFKHIFLHTINHNDKVNVFLEMFSITIVFTPLLQLTVIPVGADPAHSPLE